MLKKHLPATLRKPIIKASEKQFRSMVTRAVLAGIACSRQEEKQIADEFIRLASLYQGEQTIFWHEDRPKQRVGGAA